MIRLLLFLLITGLWETQVDDDDTDDSDEDTDGDLATKLKNRKEQVERLARKLDQREKAIRDNEARIAELEAGAGGAGEANNDARLENAYLRAAIARGNDLDLDTAYDLMRAKGILDTVTVDDSGAVQGMDEAVETVVSRYPWLTDISKAEDSEPVVPPKTGGAGKGMPGNTGRRASLEHRFPALRGRRSLY